MDIRTWRTAQGLTLQALADKLAIKGSNPARTLQRWELGAVPCPAEVVERIRELSAGAVTPGDFHDVRLAFLRSQDDAGRLLIPVTEQVA